VCESFYHIKTSKEILGMW